MNTFILCTTQVLFVATLVDGHSNSVTPLFGVTALSVPSISSETPSMVNGCCMPYRPTYSNMAHSMSMSMSIGIAWHGICMVLI